MKEYRSGVGPGFRFLAGSLKGGLWFYGVGIVLSSGKALLESMLSGQLYKIVIQLCEKTEYKTALIQMGFLAIGLVGVALAQFLGEQMVIKASLRTDRNLRSTLIRKICRMPEGKRTHYQSGYFSDLFGRDMDVTGEIYKTKWGSMLARLISVVGGLWILARYNVSLTVFCFFCGLVYFVMIFSLKNQAKHIQQQTFAALGKLSKLMGEISLGLPIIRFYQLKDRFDGQYKQSAGDYALLGQKNVRVQTLAGGLRNFGYSFSYVGILIFGLALVSRGKQGLDDFMYLWSIGIGVAYAMQSLGTQMLEYQENAAALERVMEGCGLEEENQEGSPVEGSDIVFDQASFGYEDKQILKEVSFAALKGQKVAIVGSSGGGKTTMVRLMMGFYSPTEGTVSIGGVSTAEANLRSLRAHIAYLPQMPFLFDESIRENLELALPDAKQDQSDEKEKKLYAAIEKAGLDRLLKALPDGLDTVVGENGSKLSGGERQRIGLARCFLKDADIYVMDEMTSALDAKLEEEIVNRLFAEKEKTVICITHRPAATRHADRVLVLDQGRIEESSYQKIGTK